MRVQKAQGRRLKAEALGPEFAEIVRIADVKQELCGPDQKFCLYFEGHEKSLVLNATNIDALTAIFGSDESSFWIGQRIELFTTWTTFQGTRRLGIRIRPAPRSSASVPPYQPPTPPQPRDPTAARLGMASGRREREPGEDDEGPVTSGQVRW